ncbi:hypothetical protein DPMN_108400, partial [Dreissena polymorpha]
MNSDICDNAGRLNVEGASIEKAPQCRNNAGRLNGASIEKAPQCRNNAGRLNVETTQGASIENIRGIGVGV